MQPIRIRRKFPIHRLSLQRVGRSLQPPDPVLTASAVAIGPLTRPMGERAHDGQVLSRPPQVKPVSASIALGSGGIWAA